MTQHTLTHTRISRTGARRDPWWIPLGAAITSLFDRPTRDVPATSLPPEVLRDHDPALHRALAARVAGHCLDAGSRSLLY